MRSTAAGRRSSFLSCSDTGGLESDGSIFDTSMKEVGRQPREVERRRGFPAHWSAREIAVRLFLTCWIIYALHFSTNIVREIYLTLSIGDHASFRVDRVDHREDPIPAVPCGTRAPSRFLDLPPRPSCPDEPAATVRGSNDPMQP